MAFSKKNDKENEQFYEQKDTIGNIAFPCNPITQTK